MAINLLTVIGSNLVLFNLEIEKLNALNFDSTDQQRQIWLMIILQVIAAVICSYFLKVA